ncbi:hypothetical protein BKA69DRAFT_1056919 [Paraphysoderma sedebokerense]|nr:hypothetical protein BKA69DRAFT_1056919 [Paraphysoderma sedebokerense]
MADGGRSIPFLKVPYSSATDHGTMKYLNIKALSCSTTTCPSCRITLLTPCKPFTFFQCLICGESVLSPPHNAYPEITSPSSPPPNPTVPSTPTTPSRSSFEMGPTYLDFTFDFRSFVDFYGDDFNGKHLKIGFLLQRDITVDEWDEVMNSIDPRFEEDAPPVSPSTDSGSNISEVGVQGSGQSRKRKSLSMRFKSKTNKYISIMSRKSGYGELIGQYDGSKDWEAVLVVLYGHLLETYEIKMTGIREKKYKRLHQLDLSEVQIVPWGGSTSRSNHYIGLLSPKTNLVTLFEAESSRIRQYWEESLHSAIMKIQDRKYSRDTMISEPGSTNFSGEFIRTDMTITMETVTSPTTSHPADQSSLNFNPRYSNVARIDNVLRSLLSDKPLNSIASDQYGSYPNFTITPNGNGNGNGTENQPLSGSKLSRNNSFRNSVASINNFSALRRRSIQQQQQQREINFEMGKDKMKDREKFKHGEDVLTMIQRKSELAKKAKQAKKTMKQDKQTKDEDSEMTKEKAPETSGESVTEGEEEVVIGEITNEKTDDNEEEENDPFEYLITVMYQVFPELTTGRLPLMRRVAEDEKE